MGQEDQEMCSRRLRSARAGCDDWDDGEQCCHTTPGPSPTPKQPGHGTGYDTGHKDGYSSWHKRDVKASRLNARDQTTLRDDIDDTFCPSPKAW